MAPIELPPAEMMDLFPLCLDLNGAFKTSSRLGYPIESKHVLRGVDGEINLCRISNYITMGMTGTTRTHNIRFLFAHPVNIVKLTGSDMIVNLPYDNQYPTTV